MPPALPSIEELREEWKHIYGVSLPAAATSKSQAQHNWPVHVDHCFARIILDSTVGITSPWMSKIKAPAYKNMSEEQLKDSINLGEQILIGEVDLEELNERSLELRGKKRDSGSKARKGRRSDPPVDIEAVRRESAERRACLDGAKTEHNAVRLAKRTVPEHQDEHDGRNVKPAKRSAPSEEVEDQGRSFNLQTNKRRKVRSRGGDTDSQAALQPVSNTANSRANSRANSKIDSDIRTNADLTPYIKKIALSQKTPYQKKVLTLLCEVPPGQYTTYGAMAKHLGSSARAVGNAIRNNPFAPEVPCHRILATGGGIGGFHGSWGRNGQPGLNDDKKRKLLREEGVKFDGKGKVVGAPWAGFK